MMIVYGKNMDDPTTGPVRLVLLVQLFGSKQELVID
jgi:hypothetical protein